MKVLLHCKIIIINVLILDIDKTMHLRIIIIYIAIRTMLIKYFHNHNTDLNEFLSQRDKYELKI